MRLGAGAALCRRSRRRRRAARLRRWRLRCSRRWRSASASARSTGRACFATPSRSTRAAAAICGGLLLALAGWLRHRDRVTRIAAVLGAGMRHAGGVAAARAALRPRTAGDGRSGDLADLARATCARCSRCWSVLRTESADRRRHRRVPGGGAGRSRWSCCAEREAAPRFRVPRRGFGVLRRGGHHRRRDPRLFLRDLARHAAGRRAGAAAVCGAARSNGWCRAWRPLWS